MQEIQRSARAWLRTACNVALAGSVLLLAACASPYVRAPLPPAPANGGPPSVDAAVAYAYQVQGLYRDKLAELGEEERRLSNGLIGLGGLVLGMGALGAHSSVIKGTAIAGGTVLTAGEFSTDKNRAAVYGAGIEAINCAVAMASPLQLASDRRESLKTRLDGADNARSRVVELRKAVVDLLGKVKATDRGAAQDAIDKAGDALSKSAELAAAAERLLLRHEQAGPDLRNAVSAIDATVSNSIRALEVDIRAVRDALGSLAGNSGLFGKLSTQEVLPKVDAQPMSAPAMGKATGSDELDNAVARLQVATEALVYENARLAGWLNAIEADTAKELRQCKVNLPFFQVSVTPSTLTFTQTASHTLTAMVTGGQISYNRVPTYTATFVTNADGLAASVDGGRLTVTKSAQATTGTHTLRIQETKAGTFTDLPVVVGAPGAPGPQAALEDAKAAVNQAGVLTLDNGAQVRVVAQVNSGLEVRHQTLSGTAQVDDIRRKLLSIPAVSKLGASSLKLTP